MGARHQIYIIANVLGRYRVVAVYHIQSLYPPEAVYMAWSILQHVKKHAGPFEKELQCLQQGRYNKNDTAYPCPFLAAVLFQCVQDYFGTFQLMFPLIYMGEDNNSGFTGIDVTEPFSPAYCFWPGWDGDHYGFPPDYPIDPEGFALRYYVEPGEEFEFQDLQKEVQDAILALQGERFIGSRQTLDEAWENWSPTLDEMDEEPPSEDAKEFTKTLRTAIEAGSTENAQQMADGLSSTSGVAEGLRRTLRRERLPKCCDPVIVKGFIIAQHLSNSNELDLSWMQLSPAQVLKVIRAVLQNDSFKISSLDISGNSDVTIGTLSEIFKLREASNLKRVFVFGCPKVEDFRRTEIRDRIGAGKETEVFNSYFPKDDSDEFCPWKTKPHSGQPRPRV
ncbi:hypothetical protein M407DRAFT_27126 [Tulasnella calospora MUT 4182]|uniref:Uncharacterized protein n=1 Tax=Tulasnella calospora MUT 4182 TaxID=1051891 RepID=A0A0C3LPV1_9AGAM|nr:hypothetical protein M407DRAFT_27126 [Tulasnella calospora MUT 4182]